MDWDWMTFTFDESLTMQTGDSLWMEWTADRGYVWFVERRDGTL